MEETKMVDESMSFKGYSFKTWFEKNKLWFVKNADTVKAMISGAAALIAAQYASNVWIQLLFGATGGYVTRLIVDGIDYWLAK
jgi:hypothetical protein